MKRILMAATALLTLFASVVSFAADKFKFSFENEDITKIVKEYSKQSGQRFVMDSVIKGKATILNPDPVSTEEAFNQLSMALAANGLGISKQGDVMLVQQARQLNRTLIEVSTELPPLKPERMHTWVINLKNANAQDINREIRILTSRDGELVPATRTNQILVTDWVSNLHRIAKIIAELDKPAGPVGPRHGQAPPPPPKPKQTPDAM